MGLQHYLKILEEVKKDVSSKLKNTNRLIFVSGNFNVIHPGHMRFLNFAASMGDCLVVGLNRDDARGVFIEGSLRLEALSHLKIVDYAFIIPHEIEACLELLKPAVVVKGKEYEERYNREREVVESYGGRLVFSSGEVRFSSMDLLQNELFELNLATIIKPHDYLRRHNIKINKLINIIRSFSNLKIVVVGDIIIDEYVACDPLGMSQEDPTIVVAPVRQDIFLGGAGIVSAHAKGLGANVSFFSVVGMDDVAEISRKKLSEHGVEAYLFTDETRRTTLKKRYRANGKTLLRVSYLDQHGINNELSQDILKKIEPIIAQADLLVFSDFNYGCLPQQLVDGIILLCKKFNVPMSADSQSSSQAGDIARFSDMLLVTPTEREARLAIRNPDLGLAALAQVLYDKKIAENIFITLGSEGLIVQAEAKFGDTLVADQLPALNTSPKDVAGAGDCLLICSSMSLVAGANAWEAAYLGAVAAACQVGRVGNLPLASSEIIQELNY